MNMQAVLFEVAKERGRQDEKWGGPAHDDRHTIAEFAKFIEGRAYRARVFDVTNPGFRGHPEFPNIQMPRQMLIEIAALAVAAVESIDRKQTPSEVERLMDSAGLCRRCAAPIDEPPNT